MSLALLACVFFISLTKSVNGAQFLNTTSFLFLFEFALDCGALDIVPLTSKYA